MNIALSESYRNNEEHALYFPNAEYPKARQRLQYERATSWPEQSVLEAFGKSHFALIVRRGAAQRLATWGP
jgi:hypothetical protein